MGAFHAYDIRGIYNKDFDKNTVYKIGYFIPELLKTKEVLVGRDMRNSSPEIHDYLIKGLTDAGANVTDIGLSTTPLVYFGTAAKGFKASVQITASHNPREYNGLKVSRENALPVGYDAGLGTIEKWINEGKATPVASSKGIVKQLDLREEYLTFQRKYVGDISNLKIGIDISNGMASLFIKDLLPQSENIQYIFDEMDGTFPNHEANPLIPENTLALRNFVKKNKCDIGVIYDGDADRVMFIDENGEFISPDLMIALLGNFFLKGIGTSSEAKRYAKISASRNTDEKIKVLQEIRSSKAVAEYLAPMNAEVHTWKVGRAFAAPKLREIDGLFGGELAGHFYFKDFYYSDSGIMASLIILDIVSEMKRRGRTISQLISEISKYANSGEINFKIEKKQEAMTAVYNYFMNQAKPNKVMDFDGYRLEFNDWWFNIRPSNTEPYLRFLCEATSQELLEQKIAETKKVLTEFE
ncbi:MAG: phosphomannomutase/phosphoglucomutase [Bacteroidales bacterium]